MAIPIQNTCRLLGEPLSIAEKTDRTHQLSVISYQLSVISYQLSVISYQSSVIRCDPKSGY
ncbi:MAG: hypothetical protein GPJ10_04715 [Microcystis aeruginosa L211-07]|nr:hypothetical protein [Microcystis aeruginosa L211-07]